MGREREEVAERGCRDLFFLTHNNGDEDEEMERDEDGERKGVRERGGEREGVRGRARGRDA